MLQNWSVFDDMCNTFGLSTQDIPMDVRESDKGFEIEVDLPGVEPTDIDIGISDGKLSVKAERKWAKGGSRTTFRRSFFETFILPQVVDSDGILATYAQGVLRVTIPKRVGSSIRKVEVKPA